MNAYADFISRKSKIGTSDGFKPLWIPDQMKDFQKYSTEWSINKGRSALLYDCGLGKSFMELAWLENVKRKTNKPVLLLTPLAVGPQMIREGAKFGIDCKRSSGGSHTQAEIIVTNYEKLHHFNRHDFAGVACDESSCIKAMGGERRKIVTEFMRETRYRLLGTATAAPNDFVEVGTSSEALGYLGAVDMVTRFFKEDINKDYLGWGRKSYRFRGHAEHQFWKWVCSWARACRKPSDIGFSDEGYNLPPLIEKELVIEKSTPRDGFLFSTPAEDLHEQREERRVTMRERCEAAAKIVGDHNGSSVIWCQLNPEGDLLEKMIPDAVQVSGSDKDEKKEEAADWFANGSGKRILITKSKIYGWGLNFQSCNNVVTFTSHSYESYYQSIRRCWRFGQKNPVTATTIATKGGVGVIANLRRKSQQADHMFSSLVEHMAGAMIVDRDLKFNELERRPSWLVSSK